MTLALRECGGDRPPPAQAARHAPEQTLTDAGRICAATGRGRVSFAGAVEELAAASGADIRYMRVSRGRCNAALLAEPRVPEEVVMRLRRVVNELLDLCDARPT